MLLPEWGTPPGILRGRGDRKIGIGKSEKIRTLKVFQTYSLIDTFGNNFSNHSRKLNSYKFRMRRNTAGLAILQREMVGSA
jgi:hypothetical protein